MANDHAIKTHKRDKNAIKYQKNNNKKKHKKTTNDKKNNVNKLHL